jgi:hypothetical protein
MDRPTHTVSPSKCYTYCSCQGIDFCVTSV